MKFWNFVKNQGGDVELRIEGEIASDDDLWFYEWLGIQATTPNTFRNALNEYKGQDITVWIDSWGGDVFAGIGIYNSLKEHKGKVTVKVDGKAVSAGSIIAMAGAETLMTPGSLMMVHNPWAYKVGEAKDMRHTADVLDEIKAAIVNVYQIKTNRSRNHLAKLMDNETWMSARTAKEEGFADGILYTEPAEPRPQNAYMLSGLAIQNSANDTMKKLFELLKKREAPKPGEGPPQGRVFDIKKRVKVREIKHRRKEA